MDARDYVGAKAILDDILATECDEAVVYDIKLRTAALEILSSGDLAKAEVLYRSAIEMSPDNPLAWRDLGELYGVYHDDPVLAIGLFSAARDRGANKLEIDGLITECLNDMTVEK